MFIDDIFVTPFDFEEKALSVFQYQAMQPGIYHDYIRSLNIDAHKVNEVEKIPFLPISFFKSLVLKEEGRETQIIFSSSGTSGRNTSNHFITDLDLYIKSFTEGFRLFYGNIKKYCFLALLPSYLERNGSSLVFMCDHLIKQSQYPLSGFCLDEMQELIQTLETLRKQKQPVILLGVTYALLDLAEKNPLMFPEMIIIETGGMKGRRKEMIREEVHAVLKKAFGVSDIHSEYGMTELLSQAWSKGDGVFTCPPWMRIYIRDVNDPFQLVANNISGAVNVIDLANIFSCSFIATDDLGRKADDQSFQILGRLEDSDLRGCNLLV